METIKRPFKRTVWPAVAIMALAAALTLLVADVGVAKWKKGAYVGRTSQGLGISLDLTKKRAGVVYIDFHTGCGVPMCEPSFAGISDKIHKKGKKGTFDVPSVANGYYGYVKGTVKGKKAEGTACWCYTKDPEDLPLVVTWEAKHE